MTVGELRAKYREAFGEESRSGNRTFLWRRIAWRLQELDEGGLSERAMRRAKELTRDADLRVRPPKGAFADINGQTITRRISAPHDPRLPMVGTVLTREYGGETHQVTVLPNGFEHDGEVYRSLTAVTKAIAGVHWNGFHFFNLGKRRKSK
jgi:hypothetical protein